MEYTYKDISQAYKDNVSSMDFVSNTKDDYCKICYAMISISGTILINPKIPFISTSIFIFGNNNIGQFKINPGFECDFLYLYFGGIDVFLVKYKNKIVKYKLKRQQFLLNEKFYFKVKEAFEG